MPRPVIAVVGAGFSGALTALNILAAEGSRAKTHLIEAAPRFGLGAAFGTAEPEHLLNVRAQNMSADPDRPDDFMAWLATRRGQPPDPFAFASRRDYGAYVQARLRQVALGPSATDRLNLVPDQAVGIEANGDGFSLRLGMGRRLDCDAVVLAIGNPAPSVAVLPDPTFAEHPAYIGSPWAPGSLERVDADDAVLLLGAGLTMVDVMASLSARGHRGGVTALSRRGLAPLAHAGGTPAAAASWTRAPGERLSESLRRFRRHAAMAGDWRAAFDALRPTTQALWRAMDADQRARFLRHLRPWWDIHRHRLAPRVAEQLAAWRAGRLEIRAGRLDALLPAGDEVEARWTPRGERQLLSRQVRWVINCTGPEGDVRRLRSPLVQSLLTGGLARPDPFGLGLDVTEDARLLDAQGRAQPRLYGVGPIARGALWEVSAVPDIRVEARRLGRVLARLDLARPADAA